MSKAASIFAVCVEPGCDAPRYRGCRHCQKHHMQQYRSRRKASERGEQEALFDFLARMEGRYPLLKYVFHVPNEASGGGRKVRTSYQKRDGTTSYRMTPIEALTNARMGVKKGVWDIWLPACNRVEMWGRPARMLVGLVLEMKAPGGELSSEQQDWRKFLQDELWGCAVCFDWADAARLLIRWVGGDPADCGL